MSKSYVCPDCNQRFKPSVGHCRGGKYGGCCRSFVSNRGGDSHQVGDWDHRRCLSDQELHDLGWFQDVNGYWVSPLDVAKRARAATDPTTPWLRGTTQQDHPGTGAPAAQDRASGPTQPAQPAGDDILQGGD